MKKQVFKKIFSSMVVLAMAVGANTASANSISIVESASNVTPLANLVAGDTFSLDVNVVLDAGIVMGGSATMVDWSASTANFSYNGYTSTVGSEPGLSSSTATSALITRLNLFGDMTITGPLNWATLNFTYNGGTASPFFSFIMDPTVVVNGLQWAEPGNAAINFATVNNLTTVPLPPAFLLLGSALVGLGFTGRRKAIVA